ncbi:MAG: hypothetical protein MZW92_57985 [Comamonadaceae bacterium]|nr:hypothetical protein [Comamonadaceae bacterium]
MSLLTYYKIVATAEPANYTWTLANPSNDGGSAVGGILAFSGIDAAGGNPIDTRRHGLERAPHGERARARHQLDHDGQRQHDDRLVDQLPLGQQLRRAERHRRHHRAARPVGTAGAERDRDHPADVDRAATPPPAPPAPPRPRPRARPTTASAT